MASHLFFFGRSEVLAGGELSVFFPTIEEITPEISRVEGDTVVVDGNTLAIDELLSLLGGTVKIGKVLYEGPTITEALIVRLLGSSQTQITFGMSSYTNDFPLRESFVREVKELLAKEGISSRYLLPKNGSILSSVVVAGQKITEFCIVKSTTNFIVCQTECVQDFTGWNKRDYDRPHVDPKRGMLPPKVSRMIANIGLGSDARGKTLLDPFCGVGTILSEAMFRHVDIIGSDYDAWCMKATEANLSWITSVYGLNQKPRLFLSDATHVSETLAKESVDAIVTEPFMGTTELGEGKITDVTKIKNIMKGLEKLYRGCLSDWHAVLKPQGKVVIAIPEVSIGKTILSVKNVIDSCEKLGYTKLLKALPYSRPQAIVRRAFYILEKKG